MEPRFETLPQAAAWYRRWLTEAALPLWSSAGVDAARGSFHEALTVEGEPAGERRRSRVQSRQVWVFATAAVELGDGRYAEVARRAYAFWRDRYRLDDGLFAYAADEQGRLIDRTTLLYEQAFALFAMAAMERLAPGQGAADAARTRGALEAFRHNAGGYREQGDQPFQANALMHLLEACLAWEELGGASWRGLADEIAELARARFVDARGVLHEFFDAAWTPLGPEAGGLAIAAVRPDGAPRDRAARLWAQAERLRAALHFREDEEALAAANGLRPFLDTPRPGTWRERADGEGSFLAEPSPATSLYHLVGGLAPLLGWGGGSRA
jgi:mannose/cellobiose epimerase-like protein (N-acyl-D-glucosamine 2-epimerase family)